MLIISIKLEVVFHLSENIIPFPLLPRAPGPGGWQSCWVTCLLYASLKDMFVAWVRGLTCDGWWHLNIFNLVSPVALHSWKVLTVYFLPFPTNRRGWKIQKSYQSWKRKQRAFPEVLWAPAESTLRWPVLLTILRGAVWPRHAEVAPMAAGPATAASAEVWAAPTMKYVNRRPFT